MFETPRAPSAGLNVAPECSCFEWYIQIKPCVSCIKWSHRTCIKCSHTNRNMSYLQHTSTINSTKQTTQSYCILVKINTHRVYNTDAFAIIKKQNNWYVFGGTKNVPLSFLSTENESRRPEAPSSPTYATRRCVCAHPWCAPSGRLMGVCLFVFFSGPTPKDRCIYVKGNAHNKKGMASLAEFLVINIFFWWNLMMTYIQYC